MPLEKILASADEAVAGIFDGATVMVGGKGTTGSPEGLLMALVRKGAGHLTCISGGRQSGETSLARLVSGGQVKKLVTTPSGAAGLDARALGLWRAGQLDVEVVSEGTLAERVRAGGAGLGGVFLPSLKGATFENGKERRLFDGDGYVLETPLKADFALLRAHTSDTLGNLVYRRSQRNWNPVMAMAAGVTIVEVDETVETGGIDPELVITPGIYVDRVVVVRE